MPKLNVTVDLTGVDGNAFSVLGAVARQMKRAGHADLVSEFTEEATSGDYDNLLLTVHKWVNVEFDETTDEIGAF